MKKPNLFILRDGSKVKVHSFNYSTTVNNFNIIDGNRGEINGYDDSRVDKLMKLMSSKDKVTKFIWELSTIKVLLKKNKKGGFYLTVIDGANRITAVKNLIKKGDFPADYQVPFTIIDDPYLNKMSNPELIDFISIINEYDPRWTEKEHYNAAKSSRLPTALSFQMVLADYSSISDNYKYCPDKKTITLPLNLNVLYSVATKTELKGGKVTYRQFRDNSISDYMNTDHFQNDYESLLELMTITIDWHMSKNLRPSKTIRAALSLVYNEKKDSIQIPFQMLVNKLKATNKIPRNEAGIRDFMLKIAMS